MKAILKWFEQFLCDHSWSHHWIVQERGTPGKPGYETWRERFCYKCDKIEKIDLTIRY